MGKLRDLQVMFDAIKKLFLPVSSEYRTDSASRQKTAPATRGVANVAHFP